MSDGVFVAQGFIYNLPRCPIDVPHPACLSNLVVVAQIQEVTDDQVVKFQLGHLYLTSTTETRQQPWNYHYCHKCRLISRCCHDETRYRDLDMSELEDVKSVLFTYQSEWALERLLPQTSFFGHMDTDLQVADSLSDGGFESLLKQILGNTNENKDARRSHSDDLLRATQNTTLSTRQASKVKQLSVSSTRVAMLLHILPSSCFKRAGIQETVSEWWERAHAGAHGSPISIECEFFNQQRDAIDPTPECFVGTNVTSQTLYSWALVQHRDEGSFNVLFLENDLTVGYIECAITDEPSDTEFALSLLLSLRAPVDETSGSIVRSATVMSDGSFRGVEFLSQWPRYSGYVNKVALDFLRISACASFLQIPVHRVWEEPMGMMMMADPAFASLMATIELFAKTWQEVVKAFGSSTTQTVQRKLCLGFESLDYKVDTMLLNGVREEAVPEVVNILARRALLPDREDLRLALELVVYADDFTWLSQLMQYINPAGEASFVFLGKYGNVTDHRAKIVFSQVHSSFALAKDMLIARQQSSKLGGLKEDKTYIEYVPHTLALNDALVLQMFWQMMSYHQVVMALGEQPPAYPDLSFLCDRTIP